MRQQTHVVFWSGGRGTPLFSTDAWQRMNTISGGDTQALWQDYRATRDQAVRDRLILTYAPLVKFVAGRLGSSLPSHVDEQDLVSYGLLGLIGAIERYDPDREIKFETYAILRIKVALIDTIEDPVGANPEFSLEQTELNEALAEAIARLPEREKLVVTLYYYEELTLREIGEVLGVTESRVSQLHTKAVLRLKARLSGASRTPA